MTDEGITPQARAFIADHVEAVMQLEVLLLLAGQRERAWTTAELAQDLRIDPGWVEAQLKAMAGKGLLEAGDGPPPHYRYAPRTPELGAAVADLARGYADRRVTVIGLIFSKPLDKIRSFADAFRLRKDSRDSDG